MGFLMVKVKIYRTVFGERIVEREIITRIPSPAYQGENEIKASLQQGYAKLLGKGHNDIKVEFL